jgi:hypothetical protein
MQFLKKRQQSNDTAKNMQERNELYKRDPEEFVRRFVLPERASSGSQ